MRSIDRYAIETMGVPSLKLMENAGTAVTNLILSKFAGTGQKKAAIVCGKGNNGGDGFVVARQLAERGWEIVCFLLGRRAELSGDTLVNINKVTSPVNEVVDGRGATALASALEDADVTIDAVFGTGFRGAARGLTETVIGQMNSTRKPIVSIDVPSGMDSSTGEVQGECIRATYTVTLGLPKLGFYMKDGPKKVGEVHVGEIGIPDEAISSAGVKNNVLTKEEVARLLPVRAPDAHKGACGRVLVVAGSQGMLGAAMLSSMSALRAGAGLVLLAVPESLMDVVASSLMEVMPRALPETSLRTIAPAAKPRILELAADCDAVAIGPGLSRNPETNGLVRSLIPELGKPTVLDADGLNAYIDVPDELKSFGYDLIVTPHIVEFSRITGVPIEEIKKDRFESAREAAKDKKLAIILKGSPTITATADADIFINSTGNAGLATAGTGDVLTGIVAGFLGQGMSAADAAGCAAFVHGLAGEMASLELGIRGMVAGDVMDMIPWALVEIEGTI
jgi:NAD(P)H-hydrate epimerase